MASFRLCRRYSLNRFNIRVTGLAYCEHAYEILRQIVKMTDKSPVLISVVVPTLNRPEPLARALDSLSAQRLPEGLGMEVVVIDNSRDGSARGTVDACIARNRLPIVYVLAPVPGVANARNAGVRAAQGRWIAFLDDDEEASPGWLACHVATLQATGADASFGPVVAKAEAGQLTPAFAAYFSRQLGRSDRADITDLSALLGTNNSVFDRGRCLAKAEVFDTSLNEVGGEDSLLLRQLADSGRRFAWTPGADVIEWVPPKRMNWAYVRRRRFLSGQIRTFVHHKLMPPRWASVALWMGVGAAQAALEFAKAAIFLSFDRERAEIARSKAWGGLGKLFWGERFRPKLYGSGLVS